MLPSAPLLDLLSRGVGRPLMATSGNRSGSPILYNTAAAITELSAVADFFIHHDREIRQPQDDSVLRFTNYQRRPVWLRRARGLAPLWKPDCGSTAVAECLLACGSDLKHSYALREGGNTYLSQYLGDLDNYASQTAAAASLTRLLQLTGAHPSRVLVDAHPTYHSRANGEELSTTFGAVCQSSPHHGAHLAAILSEATLLAQCEDVLGVIWDGTGYGADGQIWGGEFLTLHGDQIERPAHLAYFPVLLGDKMSREPRLSALSLLREHLATTPEIEPLFTPQEWGLYTALLRRPVAVQTSSMGRVFDAVAALLGLGATVSYEGEAAARLEAAGRSYVQQYGWAELAQTPWPVADLLRVSDWLPLLLADYRKQGCVGLVAAKFHRQLVALIRSVAERLGYRRLAFSGGVWQNTLLIDAVDRYLAADFELHFHAALPPNDENISYGQLVLATQGAQPVRTSSHEKTFANVSGNTW
jgi:hydrogenase maturation protein HypF